MPTLFDRGLRRMLDKKNQEFESKSDDEREIWNSIHHIAKNKNTEKHRNPLHSRKCSE
jgi:hypothetical protein